MCMCACACVCVCVCVGVGVGVILGRWVKPQVKGFTEGTIISIKRLGCVLNQTKSQFEVQPIIVSSQHTYNTCIS